MFRKILIVAMFATAAGYCFAADDLPQVVTSEVFYSQGSNIDGSRYSQIESSQVVETENGQVAQVPVWPLAGSDADVEIACEGSACSKSKQNDNIRIVSKIGADLVVENINEANVFICGVPYDKNASVGKGASLAPDTLRELSYDLPPLDMVGNLLTKVKLFDFGNFDGSDFSKLEAEIYHKLLKENGFHIILGGDHSIAIASERAFFNHAKENGKVPVIIHIDAHPDICDVYHDSKYSHACPNKRSLDYGLKDENLIILGVRGFEEQEVNYFKLHPLIDVFKASDINSLGVNRLLSYIYSKYDKDNYLIHISYDIDANDPCFAPGTGTPEPFGLNNIDVINLITGLVSKLNVISLDLVEISPKLDVNDITSYLGIKSLYEIIYTLQVKKYGMA